MSDERGLKLLKKTGSIWKSYKFFALLFLPLVAFGCAAARPDKEAKNEIEARAAIKPPTLIGQQMARIEARLDSMDGRLRAVEHETKQTEQGLNRLRETISKLSSELSSLSEFTALQLKEAKPKIETKEPLLPKVVTDPVELYRSAYEKFIAGKLDESVADFRIYVQSFPKSELADNAQYWIGESYYSQKKFEEAASEFQRVVDLFPEGNKVPEAIYKKAMSFIELGKKELALGEFRLLLSKFPDSKAASLAQEAIAKAEASAQ